MKMVPPPHGQQERKLQCLKRRSGIVGPACLLSAVLPASRAFNGALHEPDRKLDASQPLIHRLGVRSRDLSSQCRRIIYGLLRSRHASTTRPRSAYVTVSKRVLCHAGHCHVSDKTGQ
jgi:hypothetical protein